MTIVLPQLRHSDSNLVIWSLCNNNVSVSAKQKQPVHEFTGFTDILLDFHWRPTGEGGRSVYVFTSVTIVDILCLFIIIIIGVNTGILFFFYFNFTFLFYR